MLGYGSRCPARTHLAVNCHGGRLEIEGIRGDKTVYLKAGDLKIDVGDPADYAEVEASVKAGDLAPFAPSVQTKADCSGVTRSGKAREHTR